ncbi:MAG: hypothetical protein ACUVSX_13370 [Aggregatilineales bacterium]
MSKRRSRKASQPNIPAETLRRARQEAGLEPPDPAEPPVETARPPAPEAAAPRVSARREALPAAASSAPASRKRKRRAEKVNYEEMTYEEVLELLENPTKTVSEAQLRAQYGHVISDLRSMFALAAALFITMIVVAALVV